MMNSRNIRNRHIKASQAGQMLSSADFQREYDYMYSLLRNYIWEFPIVEALADVEVDTYDSFIDRDKLKNDFRKFYSMVYSIIRAEEDQELLDSLDRFKELIESESPSYFSLERVHETINNTSLVVGR